MQLICFSQYSYCFVFCKYIQRINHTAIVNFLQNGFGIIVKHPAPPMIIVDNNRYHIINMYLIMNFNSIAMIELQKTLLPILHMKGEKRIIKLAFIVEYQPPPENMFPSFILFLNTNIMIKYTSFSCKFYDNRNSRLNNPHSYTKSKLKEKDSIPSY